MSAIALGLDLTDIARIRALLERHGDRFKERAFTAQEQAYCERCADPAIHYAARFAAKEAVAKALGTGFAEGVGWTDIEVLRAESGAPSIALHEAAAERAATLGITRWLLSLTHTAQVAAASVVGCSDVNA